MRGLKALTVSAFGLLVCLLLAPARQAQAQTPMYLHAISDLRSARTYLQSDHFRGESKARDLAIEEINHALDEIKRAAVDDGKNPSETPPPQSGGDPTMPVHAAVRLLREARDDIERGHDRPENQGLRERSLEHIDRALDALRRFL